MKTKIKSRIIPRHFFVDGRFIEDVFVIELLNNRKWLPYGESRGIKKFKTREAASIFLKELALP